MILGESGLSRKSQLLDLISPRDSVGSEDDIGKLMIPSGFGIQESFVTDLGESSLGRVSPR